MAAAPAVPTKGACPPRRQSVGDMPKGPIPHRPAIPLKTPFSREAARRSRDGGFLCFGPSPWPRQETRTPQSPPDGGDSPLFKGAWTIRPAAPFGPCRVRAEVVPRPAGRFTFSRATQAVPQYRGGSHPPAYPRPQVPAMVRRFSVGRTRGTISARGRQQAGESPFDSVRRMERHPHQVPMKGDFQGPWSLNASLGTFDPRRKYLALRRNNGTDLRAAGYPQKKGPPRRSLPPVRPAQEIVCGHAQKVGQFNQPLIIRPPSASLIVLVRPHCNFKMFRYITLFQTTAFPGLF